MNIQSLIQSGILEAYVSGFCSDEERSEVERLAAEHPEVKAEIEAIEKSLESVALAGAVEPPTWMKGKILSAIEAEKPTPPNEPAPQPAPAPEASGFGKYLISRPLVWIFCLLGVLWFARNWQLNFRNEALEQENQSLRLQVNDCQTREAARKSLEQQVAFLRAPDTREIQVKALDNGARQVTIFENTAKGQAFLAVQELPSLPADKDYQLWVIVEGNAAPQALEVFKPGVDSSSLVPVSFRARAQAFAVSIEPKGGSPTGKPGEVILLGKAPS